MRVTISGGTGYIGRHLVTALLARGDEVVVISRGSANPWPGVRVRLIRGDPTRPGPWQAAVVDADAVVNLAGARIVEPPRRWTERRKAVLRESRVATTRNVAAAIRDAATPPAVLVSGSAIGYYGPRGDDLVTEQDPPGNDFLGHMASAWEAAAREAEDATTVACIRTGLVLGAGSPVLAPMLPFFRLGMGGGWGDGSEWWSWIHIADQIGLMLHLLDHRLAGAFNLTAPEPVTVDAFVKALGRSVRRPVLLRAPAWALRLALGEAADALVALQRVIPKRAEEAGYRFRYPEIDGALRDILA